MSQWTPPRRPTSQKPLMSQQTFGSLMVLVGFAIAAVPRFSPILTPRNETQAMLILGVAMAVAVIGAILSIAGRSKNGGHV